MKIFLDFGAWTGNSIARFRQLYPDHEEYKIYSFEPFPESVKRFKANYPKIKIIEAAVWDEDCKRTLRVGTGKWVEGCTLVKAKRVKRYDKTQNVKVHCLDIVKWMKNHLKSDDYIVVKFNIEGAEYKVLQHIINNKMIHWFDELWVEWHWGKMKMAETDHLEFIKQIPQDIQHWALDHQRKVLYTVITSPKFYVIEPLRITADWDYVVFSSIDNVKFKQYDLKKKKFVDIKKSNVWETRHISPGYNFDQRKLSRKIKILHDTFLPGYTYSIYVDTRFTCNCNLNNFIKDLNCKDYDITVMKHNRRDCCFKEAAYLLKSDKINEADKRLIKKQIGRYKNFIRPNLGLWAPGIMIRKHGEFELNKMMRCWYEEMLTGSHRDQISFPFAWNKSQEKVSMNAVDFKSTYEMWLVREGSEPRVAK